MSSPSVRVEKATSDLLIGPDWTINMDICDSINSDQWQAKDVVKALKRRLQNKSPKVQLLSLTLLEAMIKNCGDFVHFQVVERNILQEMIKIVKKKTDMQVRDKILVLLDSWQEAFGGPGGKHPQYYYAYDELRRFGIEFPRRSPDAAPIFTPPVTHPTARHAIAGYGMPSNSTQRLDEAMASEMESLSLSSLNSIRSVMELLTDMLQAVNPNDREAVKDEVIEDLVSQCRSHQQKLVQLLNSTGDEELLVQGLELNDSLQSLLAKRDAIASGSPLPSDAIKSNPSLDAPTAPISSPLPAVAHEAPRLNVVSTPVSIASNQVEEDEDEDDDFAQLARRRSQPSPAPSQSTPTESSDQSGSAESSSALALANPPAPVRPNTKEQDMIDLLSITLYTDSSSQAPPTPPSTSRQVEYQAPVSPHSQGYPYGQHPYPVSRSPLPFNSYVAPWAQPQSQPQPQPQFQHPQFQPQPQPQPQYQAPQFQPQAQPRAQFQPRPQFQPQVQDSQYSSSYPPPPWAASSGQIYTTSSSAPHANPSFMAMNAARPQQHYNSFGLRGNNAEDLHGESHTSSPRSTAGNKQQQQYNLSGSGGNYAVFAHSEAQMSPKPRPPTGQKPFVPSYRLFEDLIDLRNADGSVKTNGASTTSFSGSSGQSMVGGRK